MKKKLIALFLIFSMLVPLTPAVAADEAETRPTVDEILNEYHQKAFEIDMANTASSSTYSMRSVQTKDELIQETVNTLNSAGYEAYHITSENYDSVEAQMRTDFADMGLDPDGSYIIVISGEDSDDASSNSRANIILPAPDPGEDEDQTFIYNYQGIYYAMRYVTILATDRQDDTGYVKAASVDLYEKFGDVLLSNIADVAIELVLAEIDEYLEIGTIMTLLGLAPEKEYTIRNGTLQFHAGATWNRKFVQVKNSETNLWFNGSMVEYVDVISYANGLAFNVDTNTLEPVTQNLETSRHYSYRYDDTAQQKIDAVVGYLSNMTQYDTTGSIYFQFDGRTVITFIEYISN